jgi:hypothetical protein
MSDREHSIRRDALLSPSPRGLEASGSPDAGRTGQPSEMTSFIPPAMVPETAPVLPNPLPPMSVDPALVSAPQPVDTALAVTPSGIDAAAVTPSKPAVTAVDSMGTRSPLPPLIASSMGPSATSLIGSASSLVMGAQSLAARTPGVRIGDLPPQLRPPLPEAGSYPSQSQGHDLREPENPKAAFLTDSVSDCIELHLHQKAGIQPFVEQRLVKLAHQSELYQSKLAYHRTYVKEQLPEMLKEVVWFIQNDLEDREQLGHGPHLTCTVKDTCYVRCVPRTGREGGEWVGKGKSRAFGPPCLRAHRTASKLFLYRPSHP